MSANGKADTTILVVDDVAASRYALGAVLRRDGHRVILVASAAEALAELDARHRMGELPDVALVDVGLPDMSGFELCRRIKEAPQTAALPIVHFSAARVAPADRCRGLDAGGEAYLTVPAEPEEIQAVVRAVARGARHRSDAEAEAGHLTRLAETILDVQSARCPRELADAAAAGTDRLTRSPAAAFILGGDGAVHRGLSRSRASASLPDDGAHEAVARLILRIMSGHVGVRSTVAPAPLWPPGFFQAEAVSGTGPPDGARLALARSREGSAPVCLATPAYAQHPDPDTERLVGRLAHATALAAERLLMYEMERHIALTLQRSFLPTHVPQVPGTEVVVRYEPASSDTEIGGDFYAALPTSGGVLTAIGDVVGHSLDAATVMVEIRHALRAYCVEESDPRELAHRLDNMLQRYHPDVTATLCLALVDPATGRTRVANAGHIPPLVVSDTGSATYLRAHGPLLGLGLDRPAPTETVLGPTDRLLMVTDGLIETRGTDLAVSMQHLRTVAADAPLGVADLCDTLLACFGHDRDDDIALLALRLTGDR
ncbi:MULTISPECIES: SpoIIE family protein phosphatase [unclassified Streptomyces]|uniref:SpoIIE family protein phosphatase n=1 Tax=unclassified Streptomyces TaxID=2593676 RepID=UPI001CC0A03A|nr:MULTISPECIES: SpoIIE family protein phosphatase [unclassified Streptomyces]WPO74205.1 SpoIIE family protein phosphatase [Streptomyces sp. KN37]